MSSQPTDYYDQNMAILKKHQPQTWRMMTDTLPAPCGELVYSSSGKPNLRFTDSQGKLFYLHHESDPELEALHFAKRVPEDKIGMIIFFGMGLGYGPLHLIQKRPQIQHLVVFDLEPGIFRQALHALDLTPLLSDRRLILSIGSNPNIDNVLTPAKRSLRLEDIHLLKQKMCIRINREGFRKVNDDVFQLVNRLNVEGSTTKLLGKQLFENRLKNFSCILQSRLLQDLRGIFSNVPAILVSGGPSLNESIHLLPLAQERAVIIAIDTVLPALFAHDIRPDFLTTIDPEPLAYEKIADCIYEAADIPLVATIAATPLVTKSFDPRQVYWTFSSKPVETWLSGTIGGTMFTGGAGTVAHLSLLAAIVMGCSPIIFVGQDLAHSGARTHADHAVITTSHRKEEILQSEDGVRWEPGTQGENVPTDRGFMDMRNYFQEIITEYPGHYLNTSKTGLHIQGTQFIPLQKALSFYCTKLYPIEHTIRQHIDAAQWRSADKLQQEFNNIQVKARELIKIINKICSIISNVDNRLNHIQMTGKTIQRLSDLPKDLQALLKDIDRHSNKLDSDDRIWTLVYETTMEALQQSERMKHALNRIEREPGQYLTWIQKSMERLAYICEIRRIILENVDGAMTGLMKRYFEEPRLINSLQKNEDHKDTPIRLARMYHAEEDLALLRKLLPDLPQSGERTFYEGVLAAYQRRFREMETHFHTAGQSDPSLESRIADFRHRLGVRYFTFSQREDIDDETKKRMLSNGIRYCPEHEGLCDELKRYTRADLEVIEACHAQGKIEEAAERIQTLSAEISGNQAYAESLELGTLARIFHFNGLLLSSSGNHAAALENASQAVSLDPGNAQYLLQLADSYFFQNDFVLGTIQLERAIQLDTICARHWETVGDRMQSAGQPKNAISAFESCYLHMPDNIDLLKKIGDCYLALGDLEPAKEAFAQLKSRLQQATVSDSKSKPR